MLSTNKMGAAALQKEVMSVSKVSACTDDNPFRHFFVTGHWEFQQWSVHSKNVAGWLSTCICCGRNLVSILVQRQNLSFISIRTQTWDAFLFKNARLILYQVPVGALLANKGLQELMHPCSVLSAPCAAKAEAGQSYLHLKPPHQHPRIE